MTARAKERVGWLLFFCGLAIMFAEYALHMWGHFHGPEYRIGMAPIGIGAVFTFIGWFWLYRQDALTGGAFLVDGFVKVIGAIRNGRRATDAAVVVQGPPVVPVPPVDPPAPPSGRGE